MSWMGREGGREGGRVGGGEGRVGRRAESRDAHLGKRKK